MAEVVPFPWREGGIHRRPLDYSSMSAAAGERQVRQLEIQFDVLERKGVACDVIEREVLSLGRAIRAALWVAVLTPGGR